MKRLITVILSAVVLLSISACSAGDFINGKDEGNDYIYDEIFIDDVKKQEFIVFKTHDIYYHANGEINQKLNFSEDVVPLKLNNGEFAVIFGDARIENGGIAGFVDRATITKIRSQEKLSLDDAIDKLNIPELNNNNFDLSTKIIKYTSGNNIYIIFKNGAPIATTFDIYRNSVFVKSVERLDEYEIQELYDLLERVETNDNAG